MMKEQISIQQINNFSKEYNKNKTNKIIENAIMQNGLENTCINQKIIMDNPLIFNIELPESKRYDQKKSGKCWIYAGLNMIKHNVAQNLNVDIMNFELSNNYIAFFDKLEKSNNVYENIIKLENIDLDYIHKEKIMQYCVAEGGYWEWFKSIVLKYGIVPLRFMPDCVESTDYEKISNLYTEKVKKDIYYLLKLKKENQNEEKLREQKEKFLQENYNLLSKILGEPVYKFDYEYMDKDNKYEIIKGITPTEFRDKYLTLNLENYVSIGNLPMYNKEYYKIYQKKYMGNIYQESFATFINLPIERLKELSIMQLKEGTPVYMGVNIRKFCYEQNGILDTRIFNYKDIFEFNLLTKEEALNMHDIDFQHAMVFCGVHVLENKPVRWKIEDSYGDGIGEKEKGYYIMNDNYFDEFVLNVIIDKKYLTDDERKILEQNPIEFEIEDPF